MAARTTESGIIRTIKDRNHPYKTMNTSGFEDQRLSYEARGVLAYLLSKPDDWQVRPENLQNDSCGRDKIRRILRELEQHGYLIRERVRLAKGRWEWISTVFETPRPPTENQAMDKPPTPRPSTENQAMDKPLSNAETSIDGFSGYGPTIDAFSVDGKHVDLISMDLNKHERECENFSRTPRNRKRDLVFEALAEVARIDWTVCTKEQRDQLNQSATILRKSAQKKQQDDQQVADAIRYVGEWFMSNDWRGKRGDRPTPANIREVWRQAIEARASENNHDTLSGSNTGQVERRNPERAVLRRASADSW